MLTTVLWGIKVTLCRDCKMQAESNISWRSILAGWRWDGESFEIWYPVPIGVVSVPPIRSPLEYCPAVFSWTNFRNMSIL